MEKRSRNTLIIIIIIIIIVIIIIIFVVVIVESSRWPSGQGVRFESGRSGLRIPLAPWGFWQVESYQ